MSVKVNNQMRILAVIGDPIDHSKSPLIQNTMLRLLGLNYIYTPVLIRRGRTAEWLSAARELNIAGFNATMPHKTELVPLMDELSEDAARCGAVNTVLFRNERFYGHNTDGIGFVRALSDERVAVQGSRIVVLGAGGAAQSLVLKLAASAAEEIVVHARSAEKAEMLIKAAPEVVKYRPFSYSEIAKSASECDVLVNTTPLGMTGVAEEFESYAFLDRIRGGAAVCDLIYSPMTTQLLAQAETRGLKTVGGLGMLIHQAIYALELFADTEIDHQPMAKLLREVLTK